MKRLLFLVLFSFGCSSDDSDVFGKFDLRTARFIDLSYPYNDKTLYWPTATSRFALQEVAHGMSEGGYFYSAYSFCSPEHGGTHIDAPVHFSKDGISIADLSISQLVGPGVVLDFSTEAENNADARLSLEFVKGWEQRNGPIPKGAIVLLRTGWGSRWPNAIEYFGDGTQGDVSNLHFPGYGQEAVSYLIDKKNVRAIGIDTASVDYGQSQDFIVHQIAAKSGIVNFENVGQLEELPQKGFWVMALPTKIENGSGGPVRIVAIVE